MIPLDELREKFSFKSTTPKIEGSKVHKSVIKRHKSTKSIKHDPEKYKHLLPLPDILKDDLDLVFVGYNPSVRSSQVGHRFAHHSNSFWKFIYESRVVDRKVTFNDDFKLLDEYGIGFTELVMRPTKCIDEIPKEEMRSGVPLLIEKVKKYNPKVLCIVGKGIWEHVVQGLQNKKRDKIMWGLQQQDWFDCKVFVIPSTSGLVRIPKDEMLQLWAQLKILIDSERSK